MFKPTSTCLHNQKATAEMTTEVIKYFDVNINEYESYILWVCQIQLQQYLERTKMQGH